MTANRPLPSGSRPGDRALSALVVVVLEAEAVVGRHRPVLDDSAPRGVPAHVTVLFPLVPPTALDAPTLVGSAPCLRSGTRSGAPTGSATTSCGRYRTTPDRSA